jgi:hypothetical protein
MPSLDKSWPASQSVYCERAAETWRGRPACFFAQSQRHTTITPSMYRQQRAGAEQSVRAVRLGSVMYCTREGGIPGVINLHVRIQHPESRA